MHNDRGRINGLFFMIYKTFGKAEKNFISCELSIWYLVTVKYAILENCNNIQERTEQLV